MGREKAVEKMHCMESVEFQLIRGEKNAFDTAIPSVSVHLLALEKKWPLSIL